MNITLLPLILCPPTNPIVVDTTHTFRISPYIYGVNFPDWKGLGQGYTFARQGGNRLTAYNWENNASNAGSDWHHQNDSLMGETDEAGWASRTFFQPAQAHGAAVLLTVPTAGYVAADKKGDGDVANTPNYLETRFIKSFPSKPGHRYVYPPDQRDGAVYQDEYVHWVERTKSAKTPLWYALDNEPDIWQSTHARIRPKNATYAEIIANNIAFASGIKSVAPRTLVFGPASYGWQGFRRFQDASDGRGRDFLNVYLSAMQEAEKRQGKRLLDVLDIHWYPEAKGGGKRITEEGDSATAAARVQAPRSLWDPTYVEDSWIADTLGKKPIVLIPGIQGQIRSHYPGTKFAITEYNYGGGNSPSGLVAQADVLGIFGRYGIFAASNWGISPRDKAQIAGFAAFVNYDRAGARFGDLGVNASGVNPATTSVYAALDSRNKNRLTLVVINKSEGNLTVPVRIKGFSGRSVLGFQVTRSFDHPTLIHPKLSKDEVEISAPGLSVTTIEVRR